MIFISEEECATSAGTLDFFSRTVGAAAHIAPGLLPVVNLSSAGAEKWLRGDAVGVIQ